MTKLEQAARQALDALEELFHSNSTKVAAEKYNTAHNVLRDALAEQAEQVADKYEIGFVEGWEYAKKSTILEAPLPDYGTLPRKQEPVAEHELIDIRCGCCGYMTYHREHMGCIKAAAPVRTKDLTDEEIGSIYEKHHSLGGCWTDGFAYERAVIAADREKNNV